MVEQDVIGHLMNVERLAQDLLADAQKEADARKTEAKGQAEKLFLADYENAIAHFESVYNEGCKAADGKRDQEYGQYSDYLGGIACNQKSFNAYLDAFFSGQ